MKLRKLVFEALDNSVANGDTPQDRDERTVAIEIWETYPWATRRIPSTEAIAEQVYAWKAR